MVSNALKLEAAVVAAALLSPATASPFPSNVHKCSSTRTMAVAFVQHPRPCRLASFSRKAVIYGWDDDDDPTVGRTDIFGGDDDVALSASRPAAEALMDKIGHDPERTGTLARLATAFSPSDRHIELGDIQAVDVVDVDDRHIELQAVVPQQDACVALRVPVDFPHSCEGEGMEDCVLQNLEELEREAEFRIGRHNQDGYGDNGAGFHNPFELVQYPPWWVSPENCGPEIVAECDQLLRTLNEPEFRGEVIALARRGLERLDDGSARSEPCEILGATVAAIGPAGIVLRADIMQDPGSLGGNKVRATEVTLAFGDTAINAEGIRSAVLHAVGP